MSGCRKQTFDCATDGRSIELEAPSFARQWCPGDYGCCTGLNGAQKCELQTWGSRWEELYPPTAASCEATRPAPFVSACFKQPTQGVSPVLGMENTSYVHPEVFAVKRIRESMQHMDFETVGFAHGGEFRRGFAASLGYMRALTAWKTHTFDYVSMNYVEKSYSDAAHYTSTTSGGSLFYGVYAFAKAVKGYTDAELLGVPLFSGVSSFDTLQARLGLVATTAFFSATQPSLSMGKLIVTVPDYDGSKTWGNLMQEAFLDPYTLRADTAIAVNETQANSIKAKNTGMTKPYFLPDDAPFWIASGALNTFIPGNYPQLLMTPHHSGVTQHFNNSNDVGGWVETYALKMSPAAQTSQIFFEQNGFANMAVNTCLPRIGVGSSAPYPSACSSTAASGGSGFYGGRSDQTPKRSTQNATQQLMSNQYVTLDSTPGMFTLKDVLATSCRPPEVTQTVRVWSSLSTTPASAHDVSVLDGGLVDPLSLLPLVARRARKIICFWNVDGSKVLQMKNGYLVMPDNDTHGCLGLEDISAYFGIFTQSKKCDKCEQGACKGALQCNAATGMCECSPGCRTRSANLASADAIKKTQIFNQGDFYGVLNQLKYNQSLGGPLWARETLQVMQNDTYGVKGGYFADVLFIMLQPCQLFMAGLPAASTSLFSSSFPNYSGFTRKSDGGIQLSFTTSEVNALALYTEWCLYYPAVRTQVNSMFPHVFDCAKDGLPVNRDFCASSATDGKCCGALAGQYVTDTTRQQVFCRQFCSTSASASASRCQNQCALCEPVKCMQKCMGETLNSFSVPEQTEYPMGGENYNTFLPEELKCAP